MLPQSDIGIQWASGCQLGSHQPSTHRWTGKIAPGVPDPIAAPQRLEQL
jgi:hypothetical protein